MIISIIDTETTGLDPKESELIEVAIVNYDTEINDIIGAMSFLIDCENKEAVKETTPIHGITPELLNAHGWAKQTAMDFTGKYIKSSQAIFAHNADFDRQWFEGYDNIYLKPWVCSCDDFPWPNYSSSKSLASIALAHGIGVCAAHRALDDTMTLARVFKRVGELSSDGNLVSHVEYSMRPKATYQANVSFNDRDKAKQAGFRWDPEKKIWWRRMVIEDAENLSFPIQEIDQQMTMV